MTREKDLLLSQQENDEINRNFKASDQLRWFFRDFKTLSHDVIIMTLYQFIIDLFNSTKRHFIETGRRTQLRILKLENRMQISHDVTFNRVIKLEALNCDLKQQVNRMSKQLNDLELSYGNLLDQVTALKVYNQKNYIKPTPIWWPFVILIIIVLLQIAINKLF
jgi:hypothetical protein